jgi:hypothetical protein
MCVGQTCEAFTREELHSLLDILLHRSEIEEGRIDPKHFWTFVTALAQERGITDDLHSAGLVQANAIPKSPSKTYNQREKRAYHIGLLIELIANIGGEPDTASILPANFNHFLILSDLYTMLEGNTGTGSSAPQVLNSTRQGIASQRKYARRILVGTVLWRMGHTGKKRNEVWLELMGYEHAEKTKLDRWLKEFGGHKGEFAMSAFATGQSGVTDSIFAQPNQYLEQYIALALSGQGRTGMK